MDMGLEPTERALRLTAFWPSAKVEGCVFGLKGLIDPRKGLAPHRPLLLKLGAEDTAKLSTQLGGLRKVKCPGKKLILVYPRAPCGEQQAAVFNPQEKLSMEQRTGGQQE